MKPCTLEEIQAAYPLGTRIRYDDDVGTIVTYMESSRYVCLIGVCFDEPKNHRHALDGLVPDCYGWWLYPEQFKVIAPPRPLHPDLREQIESLWRPLL